MPRDPFFTTYIHSRIEDLIIIGSDSTYLPSKKPLLSSEQLVVGPKVHAFKERERVRGKDSGKNPCIRWENETENDSTFIQLTSSVSAFTPFFNLYISRQ